MLEMFQILIEEAVKELRERYQKLDEKTKKLIEKVLGEKNE